MKMTSYTWTNARPTGMTTPSGQAIDYGYANGRISIVTVNGSPLLASGDYEPFGPGEYVGSDSTFG